MACLSPPTADDVRVVITTSLTDDQIDVIIGDATLIAEQCPVIATYSAATQAAIIRWLTAHYISIIKNKGAAGLTSDKLGDASQSFNSASLGDQLRATHYGNAALALDPSGCLSKIGKAKAVFEKV